jgi:hypothetical protein
MEAFQKFILDGDKLYISLLYSSTTCTVALWNISHVLDVAFSAHSTQET